MLDSNLLKFCIRNSLHSNQIVHRLLELTIYTHTQIFTHTHTQKHLHTHRVNQNVLLSTKSKENSCKQRVYKFLINSFHISNSSQVYIQNKYTYIYKI